MEEFATRPLGIFETSLDGKGRLRLPAAFHHCLGELRTFFVTALDNEEVRLYPRPLWEKLWLGPDADRLRPIAESRGGEAELDAEARILIPRELREELALAAAPVFLQFNRDHIAVIPDSIVRARRQNASASLRKAVETLRKTGPR